MAYGNPYSYYPGYYQQNTGAVPDMMGQYKAPYQQPMQAMPNMGQPQMQHNQSNDMIWVQGEAGMKAYFVAPNCTVTLWDSENPVIYLKSADANGIPSTRTLDWTERTTQTKTAQKPETQYAPMEEVQRMAKEIEELRSKLETIAAKKEETYE